MSSAGFPPTARLDIESRRAATAAAQPAGRMEALLTARDVVLSRIRTALGSAPRQAVGIPRDYRQGGEGRGDDLLELLVSRLRDYRADVVLCAEADVAVAVSDALQRYALRRVVVRVGLPAQWAKHIAVPVYDDPPLSAKELDAVDGVITSVACAIADTGTLVLDHGDGQGRRVVTLVPDIHVAVAGRTAQRANLALRRRCYETGPTGGGHRGR